MKTRLATKVQARLIISNVPILAVPGCFESASEPNAVPVVNAENRIAIGEKKLGEKSGTAADVGENVIGAQPALVAQKIDQRSRIARAIAKVVGNPAREALFGIGEGHRCAHGNCFRNRTSF